MKMFQSISSKPKWQRSEIALTHPIKGTKLFPNKTAAAGFLGCPTGYVSKLYHGTKLDINGWELAS